MAQKPLNARILNKHSPRVDWDKAVNFIPLPGELIIYDADEEQVLPRLKVGDGVTLVNDLAYTLGPLPDENDILDVLFAIGVLSAVGDETGSVYTDENNAVLLL